MQNRKRDTDVQKTFGLCGRRWGWDVSKELHVYYPEWNRSPAQVGCMRQMLGPGALGRPIGIRRRGRWERGSGWGIHVTPWLIHVNLWQNPLKCCEVISLQLIKINEKKRYKEPLQINQNSKDNIIEKNNFSFKMDWERALQSSFLGPIHKIKRKKCIINQ